MTLPVHPQQLYDSSPQGYDSFNGEEKKIIGSDPAQIMRLWRVDNEQDSILLYTQSVEIEPQLIGSCQFNTLVSRMLVTVNDPNNPGVGIAAPQVGILRRLILVKRLDKEGEPFEAYVNPRIIEYSKNQQIESEGCLSVPGKSGRVIRSEVIKIAYTDIDSLKEIEEEVEGFTAIIFQHEIDHLDGIIFTDRMEDNKIQTFSYSPQGVCASQINIVAENGYISAVQFLGGCKGNSAGLIALLEGMHMEDAIDKLEGIICGNKGTSCPDQLAKALKLMMTSEE